MTAGLVWTEIKLLAREPLVLVVSLLFPLLLMALLLVSFSDDDGTAYLGLGGATFYVTAYLSAAVAAMGFMGTPTHLASYRSSGVLRRFRAAGIRSSALLLAQIAVMAILAVVGAALMLSLAYAGWDLTGPESAVGVVVSFGAGVLAFAALGVFLGSVIGSARAAQGLGLLLFFGTFFLVGGGPPPDILPDALSTAAGWTPTGMLVDAIQSPWIGDGYNVTALLGLGATAVIASVLAIARLARI
ncbi:MAG: ABC transporter permease [Dactylosporangium sp.]|nr:ABC transporter permease [Dactylosporangium sp.]NNJ62040.1 ABC transporter permease [Dactylosporangium sp.]